MSREQRPSVIYAKVDKQRSQTHEQQSRSKYDTRSDAYRLYQHGRQQSREQDHYNSHYLYDNRHEAGYRKPIAYQDHHNSHLAYDNRQSSGHHAAHDHYNPQYKYSSGQQARYDDPRYKNEPRQEYKYAVPRQDGRYISDNRKYQVQPLYRQDRGPPGAPHPHPSYYKDYSQNPLQELFTPPEGHQSVHEADVHADASCVEPPQKPDPPQPPEPPVDEKEEEKKRWKPRKIREYRIFKKNRKGDSSDSESSSDEEETTRSGKKEKKKRGKKGRKEQTDSAEDNWYNQTNPDTFIQIGDITYIRARSYSKKGIDDLMKAFEGFGFVIIGILYKGGDTVLKIIAPIAAIKAYTALLTPALQAVVAGVSGGVAKGMKGIGR